ncbi:MAG: TonB-dependent receptor [Balneolaceae bacterium]|nr:MAG: TonB-dependent receptor [Balneolaceae bacterium]
MFLNWTFKQNRAMKVLFLTTFFIIVHSLGMQVSPASPGGKISGKVMDAQTHEPVPGAHVYLEGRENGTVTDLNGNFEIEHYPGFSTLVISHLGFRVSYVELGDTDLHAPLTVYLAAVPIRSDDIIITAGRMQMRYSGVYSDTKTRAVEDHMGAIPGLDMVTRANFAKDPVIRGLRDSRVNVLIDGMRLTPACVDGMDPATAYVEADNLQSIEISRGQDNQLISSTAPGGSVNFVMARPALNSGFFGNVETGYHTVSHQRSIQAALSYGNERWAIRTSGTYRDAGDLQPGKGARIAGSGLKKGNVYTSILYRPFENHRFNLRYIGDFAGKIGYPMLIMDTRRADAHITGIEHTWNNPSENIHTITTNLYLNHVQHWMDDYDRDVTQRDVMANMYMPMYGETTTAGVTSELNASSGSRLIHLKLELFSIDAFADMLMEHVDSSVRDMYLVNLGDVSQYHGVISQSIRYFTENNWIFGANAHAEFGTSRIREKSAIATYRAEYPGISTLEPTDFGYSAGLSAEKQVSEWFMSGIRISDGRRLPGHLERYGYYIYQPLDGFFYYGNPALKPERSSQAEVFITLGNEHSRLSNSTSLWVNRMENYIAGSRIDRYFKRYDNMGVATLTGFETDISARINSRWSSAASVSYVFGQHNELDEPLPMMPPLKGAVSLQREAEIVSLETRLRWASAQNRVAEQNSLETRTSGYALWDVYTRIQLTQNIMLQIGAENLLNTFFVDHLSVNSMPGAGRNIHGALRVTF